MYWHGDKGPATTFEAVHDEGTQQVIEEIARRTGGRAFLRANDIVGAVRTAVEPATGSLGSLTLPLADLGAAATSPHDGNRHEKVFLAGARVASRPSSVRVRSTCDRDNARDFAH